MSNSKFFSYAGNFHYHQAVCLSNNHILISGQPGLNRTTRQISADLKQEIDQAFENVDIAIKEAGGKGIDQVYKLIIYVVAMDDEKLDALGEALKKWVPQAPILTGIGVDKLALEGMRVEVEAWAVDE